LAYRAKRSHTPMRQPEKKPKAWTSASLPVAACPLGTMPGKSNWESAGVPARSRPRYPRPCAKAAWQQPTGFRTGAFSANGPCRRPLTPAAPFDGARPRALAHRSRPTHHGHAQGASGSQKAGPMGRLAVGCPPTGRCRESAGVSRESEGDTTRLAASGSHRACRPPSQRGQTRLKHPHREPEGVAQSKRATVRYARGRAVGVSRRQCPVSPLGSGARRRAEQASRLETGVKRRAPGVRRR
jgi:hypothetical protein